MLYACYSGPRIEPGKSGGKSGYSNQCQGQCVIPTPRPDNVQSRKKSLTVGGHAS